jgi:hypothetical protein
MLKEFGLDSKVKNCESWLERLRNEEFIRKARDSMLRQQDYQLYLGKNWQFALEFSELNHTQLEATRTTIRNMHTTIQKWSGSNLLKIISPISLIQYYRSS